MNFPFNTGAERIRVIEDLRKPEIKFPVEWDPLRIRQRESEFRAGLTFSNLTN